MVELLIIDDDEVDRLTIKRALGKTDLAVAVTEAINATNGLKLIKDKDFDCVLLDYRLPDQDGLQVLQEIVTGKIKTNTPFVMLTGVDDDELALKSLRAGAQDFLTKDGLTSAQLARAITNAIERQELRTLNIKIRQELTEQAAFLKTIDDTMADGLVVTDDKGVIISVNKACQKIFGYNEKKLVGKSVNILMTDEDAAKHDKKLEDYIKTGQSDIIGHGEREVRGKKKNGEIFILEIAVNPAMEKGQLVFVGCLRDITARKEAAAAVKEAEERLKLIAENMNDIIFQRDRDGIILYVSPSIEKHLGIKPKEIIGKTSVNLLHPEDKHFLEKWQKTVFKKQKPFRSQARLGAKDGRYLWFDSLTEPIRDASGKVTTAITASRNIDEQRKVEDKLKLVTENMSDIICMFDKDGEMLFISPSVRRQLGWTVAERLGGNCQDVLHPDDKAGWLELQKRVFGEGKPLRMNVRYRHKDGSYPWFEAAVEPITDEKGKITVAVMASRNITEQRKAEDQYKMLADHGTDIVILEDTNSRIIYASPSLKRHLGIDPAQAVGKNSWNLVHPEDRKETHLEWKKVVLEEKKSCTSRLRFQNIDGNYIRFEALCTPVVNEAGKVTTVIATCRNISEQYEAEEKLKMLADNASDIIVLHGQKGEIVYITPALKKHLGIDPKEVVGKQTIGVVHPEDKKDLSKYWNQRVLGEGKPFYKDIRFRDKKGDYLWFECHSQPVKDKKGRVIAAVTTSRNISEYKRAESEALRLGRIVEESLNEVYTFDAKTLKFISVNRGARENLGYSMTELQKMTPLDIKPEFTRKTFLDLVKPLLSGESERIYFETVHKRKDGSEYDVEVYLQLSKIGVKPVFVAIIEDITDKKAVAENLHQAQKMEAVGNLSGGIAHDFNNLLTAIQGSLQLFEMVETDMSADGRECLNIAIKSTKRGADLTHRLLAFSRKQTLKPNVVEVNELVRDMIPMLRRTIDESIEIETHLMEQEVFVKVDMSELENSLLNLTVNARDAMPGGGHLTFEVEKVEVRNNIAREREIEPGKYVVISVSDSGSGMAPEVCERVFEPFFSTKGVEKGTGLGLSMVYGFVKQSGGHITVYSETGKGTTFKLYLKTVEGRKRSRPGKRPPLDLKEKGTGTILLVEDDEGVRQFITQALKAKGYSVLDVGDGPSAVLVMNRGETIDLLLTDVILPKGMSGPEIGKEFEKRYPSKPIIYSSGYTGKAIERSGWLKEGEELLSKPYDLEVLFDWVQEKLSAGKKK